MGFKEYILDFAHPLNTSLIDPGTGELMILCRRLVKGSGLVFKPEI